MSKKSYRKKTSQRNGTGTGSSFTLPPKTEILKTKQRLDHRVIILDDQLYIKDDQHREINYILRIRKSGVLLLMNSDIHIPRFNSFSLL